MSFHVQKLNEKKIKVIIQITYSRVLFYNYPVSVKAGSRGDGIGSDGVRDWLMRSELFGVSIP